MDDNRSMVSSIYWDSRSLDSESTMPNSCYETPMGSSIDICNSEFTNDDPESECDVIIPSMVELHLTEENDEILTEDTETETTPNEGSYSIECIAPVCERKVVPVRPPPMKLQKCASFDLDALPKSPEKKDWRRSFAKRVSFTKTRILKTLSMNKQNTKSIGDHNILTSMRNSIRRIKSNKPAVVNEHKEPKTIKDTLGSDCDYFNFEKGSIQRNSESINEVFDIPIENTPIKPRRQFPQDKYLTGSEEMLQKAYNSLNRKSQAQEDKSIFDLCSTLIHLFEFDPDDSTKRSINVPGFIAECLNAFLDMNNKQIDDGLQLVNKTLGRFFNLYSESLDPVEQSKKYKVEELLGSTGVCVITDIDSRQRFVALKRNDRRNWVSFTGLLQHTEKETEKFTDQTWVCYPADSITNMYLERDCFEHRFQNCELILDSLLQLLVLLRSQLIGDCCPDIKPSDVLLISSNLSLICVFDKCNLAPDKSESALSAININGDESMRLNYQQSLMYLNSIVNSFLANSDNSCHLISASYPLDYLFFILLKLHKDINVLLDSI